jgi:hypothetical protein
MKRRNLLQSIAGLPAAAAMPQAAAAQSSSPARGPDEPVKLVFATPDAPGEPSPRFFSPQEFAALTRLGDLLMPPGAGRPGAAEAEAAAFLDFLISQSPQDRRQLYRGGLAKLDELARSRAGKPFSGLSPAEAAPLLAPLAAPWTYQEPADPFARFLRSAKEDFFRATVNSRQWAAALSGRSRGAAGMGAYWFAIES